jgi:iron complex outermembrane receptor protein
MRLTWSLTGILLATPIVGFAQQIAPRAMLAEVVVTAQRREERLQVVPISASVLGAEQLKLRKVDELNDLQHSVPNLTLAQNRSSGTTTTIAMRGQVELETTPTVDPAVGLYLGGVYLARTTGANLELIDMERVEVLRGPQGTLFGRNTTGGAISLVPQAPRFEREWVLEAGVGNYDLAEFTAILNAPITEKRLAGRLVASHSEHDGYGRNSLLGRSLGDDDTDYLRAQLRLLPSDRSELLLSFDRSRIRTDGQLLTLFAVEPGADMIPAVLGNPTDRLSNYVDATARRIEADRVGPASTSVWGTSGTLTVEFSRFTLKSITGYRELEQSAFDVDQDATPYDLGVILFRGDRQRQASQELQAYGGARDERLRWIGGVHYFEEHAEYAQQFRAYRPQLPGWETGMPAGDVRNDSLAAYGELTYAMTPRLHLTGGARYNRDGRQLTSRNRQQIEDIERCSLNPPLRDEPGTCRATLPERRFSYVPWTFVVDFLPADNTMLYARLSRGHRAGGYNIRGRNAVEFNTFEPEQVTTIEIGSKSELLDNRLRLNLALFRSQFEDIQLTQRELTAPRLPGFRFIENGGKARIEGGEVEFSAVLGPLLLGVNYGATRPRFTQLEERVEGVTLDSNFPMVPDWSASMTADWSRNAGSWMLDVHADYAWRDDVPFSYDPASVARQESYGLLNAMVSIRSPRGDLELRLWGRNLGDSRYVNRAFETMYFVSAVPGDPRTYGLTLAYRFVGQ